MAFGLSWKSRAGGPTSSTSPTRASDSEAGLSQRTGSDGARFTGMFEIYSSLGVDAPLNCFGTLAKGSCQTKFPQKKRGNTLHTHGLYMLFKLVPNGRNLGPTVQ